MVRRWLSRATHRTRLHRPPLLLILTTSETLIACSVSKRSSGPSHSPPANRRLQRRFFASVPQRPSQSARVQSLIDLVSSGAAVKDPETTLLRLPSARLARQPFTYLCLTNLTLTLYLCLNQKLRPACGQTSPLPVRCRSASCCARNRHMLPDILRVCYKSFTYPVPSVTSLPYQSEVSFRLTHQPIQLPVTPFRLVTSFGNSYYTSC